MVNNTLVAMFQAKLVTLLGDVEKFSLWAAAAALDRIKTSFEWLRLVWENKADWPNVTSRCTHYTS